MTKNWGWLLAVVSAAGLAGLVAVAQTGGQRRDDRDTDKKGMAYTGKIARVDADKRTLELSDVMTGRGGTTGAGKGDAAGGADKTTTTDKTTTGKDRDNARKMTFTIAEKATVTLDGKASTLKDLKAGHYARVHIDKAGTTGGTTGGTTKEKGNTGGDRTGSDARKDATDRQMTTSKIEAFTRAPKGDGTTGGTTGKDRDR